MNILRHFISGLVPAALLFFSGCNGGGTLVALPSATSPTVETKSSLKNFAIYYGWPSSLNSATLGWNNVLVADFLKKYNLVVFGAGLEDPVHGDYTNTVAIAGSLKGITDIYGYVGIGNTNSFSLSTIQGKIDNWNNNVHVDGIFLDEFGFDFKLAGYTDANMRTRQKAIVDYAHSLGLKVFMNAWDPDDVFVKQSSNPMTLTSGDKYLYESYIFSSASRETFSAYRAKVDKLKSAMASTGVEVYAVSTTTAANNLFAQTDFDYLILSAIADGFQGISWGTENFSASSAAMPFRTSTTLFADFVRDSSPQINSGSGTVTFKHTSGTVILNYSGPTYTIQ